MGIMNDDHFYRILDHSGYARQGYRRVRKGVKRRVSRHMAETGTLTVDAYLELLHRSAETMETFRRLMTVPISRFFRDKLVWQNLEAVVLPDLRAQFGNPLRIWSAGCSRGEEVYSLKIHLAEGTSGQSARILATDLIADRIAQARTGIYARTSLGNVSGPLRARWFETLKGGRQYRVRDALRGDIRWHAGNMTDVRETLPFHLVFLRNNVLTYEASPRREMIFAHIRTQLICGGFIIIGTHEVLPDSEQRFRRCAPCIHRLM
jgi:chemotaxis protein methyltransferase CheR